MLSMLCARLPTLKLQFHLNTVLKLSQALISVSVCLITAFKAFNQFNILAFPFGYAKWAKIPKKRVDVKRLFHFTHFLFRFLYVTYLLQSYLFLHQMFHMMLVLHHHLCRIEKIYITEKKMYFTTANCLQNVTK